MTNIIKCTLKKSISVTTKILKWGSIIGIIIATLVGIGYLIWSIRDIISSGWEIYNSWILFLLTQASILLKGVPWYVWIIIVIPSIIIVYSYLWCYKKQYPGEIIRKIHSLDTTISSIIIGCMIGGVADVVITCFEVGISHSYLIPSGLITNIYLIPLSVFLAAIIGFLIDILIWTDYPCMRFARLNNVKCKHLDKKSNCKFYNSDKKPSFCPYHPKEKS